MDQDSITAKSVFAACLTGILVGTVLLLNANIRTAFDLIESGVGAAFIAVAGLALIKFWRAV